MNCSVNVITPSNVCEFVKSIFTETFNLSFQRLIEKHFPAPDRSRIQQMLARQGLVDTKPKSLLDELGIAVPSSNGSSSASSSTMGKRKANRQAAQKIKKKAKVSSDDDDSDSSNDDHGSGTDQETWF